MPHLSHINLPTLSLEIPAAGKIGRPALRAAILVGRGLRGTGRALARIPGAIGRAVAMAYVDPFVQSQPGRDRTDPRRR